MATNEQIDVYKAHQRKNESDREIDARALLVCANQLAAAQDPGKDQKIYAEAVKRNQHLWTLFQVALCDPGNALPADLKTTLLNLSCYIDKVSFRALAEYKPELLTGIISINRNIAAGLSKKPAAENQMPAAAPPSPGSPVVMTA